MAVLDVHEIFLKRGSRLVASAARAARIFPTVQEGTYGCEARCQPRGRIVCATGKFKKAAFTASVPLSRSVTSRGAWNVLSPHTHQMPSTYLRRSCRTVPKRIFLKPNQNRITAAYTESTARHTGGSFLIAVVVRRKPACHTTSSSFWKEWHNIHKSSSSWV